MTAWSGPTGGDPPQSSGMPGPDPWPPAEQTYGLPPTPRSAWHGGYDSAQAAYPWQPPAPAAAPAHRQAPIWPMVVLLLGPVIAGARLGLLTGSIPTALLGACGIVATFSAVMLLALAGKRRRLARATAGAPGALAVVAGSLISGRSTAATVDLGQSPSTVRRRRRSRGSFGVIAAVYADRLVLTATRRRTAAPAPATQLAIGDISAALWSTTTTGTRTVPLLTLTDRRGLQTAIRIDPLGQRSQLSRFRTTLAAALTPVLRQQPEPASAPLANRMLPILIATALVGTSVATAGLVHRVSPNRGYATFGGPDHRPLAHGQPWGRPCAPILLQADNTTPQDIRAATETVVTGARAGGLNIALADAAGGYRTDQLHTTTGSAPIIVRIFIHTDPPRLANGKPMRENIGWDTTPAPDGRHDRLTYMKQDLYPDSLNGDEATTRKAIRALVAMTSGLAATARTRGSGISAHLDTSADQFSAQDVKAMRSFAGC